MPHIPYKPRPLPDNEAGVLAPVLPSTQPRPEKAVPERRFVPAAIPLANDKPARQAGRLGVPILSLKRHQISPASVAKALFGS